MILVELKGKFLIELTLSQKMALTEALVEHLQCPTSSQVFIDCSSDPAVETRMTDLIRVVTEARFIPETKEATQ